MPRPQTRNLLLYVPVVLATYAVTAASVHVLTRDDPHLPFWKAVGVAAMVGWFVPLVYAPAALVLLGVAGRLPERWSQTARRGALLATAPPLFAAAMGAAVFAISRDYTVFTWPYVAVVVVPALAYAAIVRLPERFEDLG